MQRGSSFVTGSPIILNGVIKTFEITENGAGYNSGDSFDFSVESSVGSGFAGIIEEEDIRDGALKIVLQEQGENYTEEPIIVLSGGSYLP